MHGSVFLGEGERSLDDLGVAQGGGGEVGRDEALQRGGVGHTGRSDQREGRGPAGVGSVDVAGVRCQCDGGGGHGGMMLDFMCRAPRRRAFALRMVSALRFAEPPRRGSLPMLFP